MTYPATLTPPASSALNFVIARIEGGWPFDQIANVPEALVTPGTDGKRLRVRRREYRQFKMETWVDAADYTAAITLGRAYLAAIGQPCTLAWAAGGYSSSWALALVEDVAPVVAAGQLNGLNSTPGSTAILRAVWTITVQSVGA